MAGKKLDTIKQEKAENVLTSEQMDGVTGGACGEVADDSRFLNVLLGGAVCDRYGEYSIEHGFAGKSLEVINAWKQVGVTAVLRKDSTDNWYFIDNQQVSQEGARQHAMKVVGRQLQRSDWDW